MKLELKNIKIYASLSEETTCYTASLWANGKRVAICKNSGRGECSDIDFINGNNCSEAIEIQEYCRNNPVVSWFGDKKYTYYDVATRVEEMVIEYQMKQIVKKKQNNEILLHCTKTKTPDYVVNSAIKLKHCIRWYINHNPDYLKNTIRNLTNQGYVIMNTNIDFEYLGV